MKNAVLAISTEENINIGDYVQGLASASFLENVDKFIEREKIKEYNEDECRMIMNGWYMYHPTHWPPSPKISPLFVAFHINSIAKEVMLSDVSIKYLKEHEPIGCRDYNTMEMLKSKGVDAYFSGCMTLTLGEKYYTSETSDKIYIVDPVSEVQPNILNLIKLFFMFIINMRSILYLLKKDIYTQKKKKYRYIHPFIRIAFVTAFFNEYKKAFSKQVLLNAEYITHMLPGENNKLSNSQLLDIAEELVTKYSKAKFVITSRIHCALPCLGLNTPVLYINNNNQKETSECRLGGLGELFNTAYWDSANIKLDISGVANDSKTFYNVESPVPNKILWQKYKDLLVDKCNKWIDSTL